MTNYVFIQTSGSQYQIDKEYEAFSKVTGIVLVPYGVIPFTNPRVLTGLSDFTIQDTDKVFIRGSVLLTQKDFIIPDNSYLTKRLQDSVYHDQESFNMPFLLNSRWLPWDIALNIDFTVESCSKIKDRKFNKNVFIKPVDDCKQFPGTFLPAGKSLSEILSTSAILSDDWYNCDVIVNHTVYEIQNEYRVFVVNGNIVAGSRYFTNGVLDIEQLDLSPDNFYTYLLTTFIPWRQSRFNTYVVDLAYIKGVGVKVIEYNCINCSGTYAADTQAIVDAIFQNNET